MDDERDTKEELDNAMTPFRENGVQVFSPGYSMDDLTRWAILNPSKVQVIDVGGEIVITLGLTTAPDGSLWRLEDE